jgi:site-specific recombinase XerD
MSLFFSLNRVSFYKEKKGSEFPVRLMYYFKGVKVGFKTNISVKEKNWIDGESENPIKPSDSEYVSKNNRLRGLKREVERIIDLIIVNGQEPLTSVVKSRFNNTKEKEEKEVKFDYPIVEVFPKYMKEYILNSDSQLSMNHIKSFKSSSKHILNVIQTRYNNDLYFNQIDSEFVNNLISYGTRRSLSNSTIQKLLGHFRSFFNWSREKGFHKNVSVRFTSKVITDNQGDKDIIYLFRGEVKKLYDFTDINYSNESHRNYTTEYLVDILKDDSKRVYTNLEFCRDLLLFECGLGTRYGDTIKVKIEDYDFYKKEFKVYMEKTNRYVRVPINQMTENIFRKYSKGKTGDDYLFPKTINGNFYPNQKFNQHIKEVGKLCRLLRPVSRPLHSGKKIIEGTEDKRQLFEVLSSHSGRRTFIKEGIINKIEPYVIMSMVGHKSLRVFERYFSMNDEDRKVSNTLFNFISDNPKVQNLNSQNENSDIEMRLNKVKGLLDKGEISETEYQEIRKGILKNI